MEHDPAIIEDLVAIENLHLAMGGVMEFDNVSLGRIKDSLQVVFLREKP